jgi:magnesium chelatase subunit H
MTPKRTSVADAGAAARTPIRVVIVTMDTHLASATGARARRRSRASYPGLELQHCTPPPSGRAARRRSSDAVADIAQADIVVVGDALPRGPLPAHPGRPAGAGASTATRCVCIVSASEVVELTRLGNFDMDKPASGPMALLKRLRGNKDKAPAAAARRR